MFKIETEVGDITYSQNIINRIVVEAVENCQGKAEIQNYKGKYMNVIPGIASRMNLYDEESGGIQIKEEEDGFDIQVYIVIRFGASIKRTTGRIIDYIYENTEKILGERPRNVTVTVTGTLSQNIVKRHIKVSR